MEIQEFKEVLKNFSQNLRELQKNKTRENLNDRAIIIKFLESGSVQDAREKTRQLIIKDFYIESLDILESYSDLFLLRGFVDGLSECQASLIWSCEYIKKDVDNINIIFDEISRKLDYSIQRSILDKKESVNQDVVRWLTLNEQNVPDSLVEKYLIEMAETYQIKNFIGDKSLVEKDKNLKTLWKRDDERVHVKAGVQRKSLLSAKSVEETLVDLAKRVQALDGF